MAAALGSGASAGDPFSQHHMLESNLSYLRVAELQSMIKEAHHFYRGPRISYQGRKAELIAKLLAVANAYERNRTPENTIFYKKFCDLLASKRNLVSSGYSYNHRTYNGAQIPQTLGSTPAASTYGASSTPVAPPYIPPKPTYHTSTYARPFGASADVTYAATVPQTGSFAISPFYQFKSVVGQIAKATRGPYERKRVTFRITLSTQQFESLKGPNATHTLLLLCSPFEQYSVSSVACPAPIEFPSQAEVRVNDKTLTHSFKGTKKYPGRVAPPDLKNIGDTLGDVFSIPLNTIEFWYVCATRDYACAIVHVEKIPVEKLVAALQDNILSKESVLATMKARAQDDDIVAGAATVSLKDPLSLMKMTKPARSKNCDHVQCFDPMMFLRTHEQSPSWSCPICSNKIRWSDVIIDEYMSDIIANVGKDVELVIVEPDGSWHVQGEESPEANTPRRKEDSGVIMDQPTNANPSAIDLRDVEDSPPNPVTARISRLGGVSRLSGSGVSTPGRSSDVIDLTADSDDDEPAILLPPMTTSTIAGQKRPAEEELLDSKGMVGRFPAPKRSHSSIDPNDRMANGSTLDSMGSGNGDGADGPQTASQRSRLADGSEVSPETMDRFFRADSPADVSGDRSGT